MVLFHRDFKMKFPHYQNTILILATQKLKVCFQRSKMILQLETK